MSKISFDQVFKIWIDNELSNTKHRDWLPIAKQKGFTSVVEWRLQTALRLSLDKLNWQLKTIPNPNKTLPQVLIGPFPGWQIHVKRKLNTSFADALKDQTFFEWVKEHDRIPKIAKSFPKSKPIILLQLPNKKLVHIEGKHRICAVAYSNYLGKPIQFQKGLVAAIAKVDQKFEHSLKQFLIKGTKKHP